MTTSTIDQPHGRDWSMQSFWSAIDLSDNLGRCLRVVRRMHGMQAWIMAIICFLIFVSTGMLAWTFDISSTYEATQGLATFIASSAPQKIAQYSALIVVAITYAPTLMELGGAAFAKEGSTPFQGLVIGLSLFDMATDLPDVNAFLLSHWQFFEQFSLFAYPVYWASWLLWLFMASFGFEMVCMCMFVCTLALILKGFSSK